MILLVLSIKLEKLGGEARRQKGELAQRILGHSPMYWIRKLHVGIVEQTITLWFVED
jgi:hypothetical protein